MVRNGQKDIIMQMHQLLISVFTKTGYFYEIDGMTRQSLLSKDDGNATNLGFNSKTHVWWTKICMCMYGWKCSLF